ncbi:MAG: hypothetical protein O7J95_19140 [Planctomycetota bacterium]|nr:hypothetical protein [Planctomycetota bacterium]
MLVVVAEVAGRLQVEKARRPLERLVLHTEELVATTALEALSRLEKGVPSKAVRLVGKWLRPDAPTALRAAVLDSLARTGTDRALTLVLRLAKKGDAVTRALAVGSLALVKEKPKALEEIIASLTDPARDVRALALRALGGVRDTSLVSALIAPPEGRTSSTASNAP